MLQVTYKRAFECQTGDDRPPVCTEMVKSGLPGDEGCRDQELAHLFSGELAYRLSAVLE
ncbi:hypothetical protein RZS08_07645 [Arthrospira platensis SPKY1]|nr:hypothetical protein [Arthrospira platensis SPKY1]